MSSAARIKYENLQDELKAIEARTGLYLADESVDRENLSAEIAALWEVNWAPAEYWVEMHRQACSAAGMRAEEAGFDINELIGRVIY
ncbi:hypothetical protein pf16_42 [Pseudomonas phage pf16]|uniref:Uncharacterized protein n=1 Tax=Pseudomonas phage pf16 TaxID=1815630 RepID=A0A1S5R3S5_9CAUD|nr:hypothetical protein FDG98_gp041 [Pseudomonas phage pf16]AND74965.1 hypothetical protein pf16_42 [Pseudomonas phage pf16]